jgi:peptidyl-prolyl cis-trans isomerase B (cyclophilin B)
MEVELYDSTPKHRDNFIKLAEEGFFDSLLFHRVIQGFMIQGGDPDSRNAAAGKHLGAGGPGYQIDAEFSSENLHFKGALAAARMGDAANPEKKSSGSQFYIVQGTPVSPDLMERMEAQKNIRYTPEQRKLYQQVGGTPFLDMEYTVFGRVVKGLEVIDKIAAVRTAPGDRPVEDVWMKAKVVK